MDAKPQKIKAATVKLYHHGCPNSISSEKHPGITLEQVSPVIAFAHKPKSVAYKLLWNVQADSPSELNEYLKYLKGHAKTRQMRVIDKGKNSALIFHSANSPSSSYERILQTGVVYTGPCVTRAGYEIHPIVAIDPHGINKALNELSEIGDIKVANIGSFKGLRAELGITTKQAEALDIALKSDYYTWPRSSKLDDLAKVAGISRRSLQERLRRAESKLIPYAAREFLKKHF